jgi:hypothetical protein
MPWKTTRTASRKIRKGALLKSIGSWRARLEHAVRGLHNTRASSSWRGRALVKPAPSD